MMSHFLGRLASLLVRKYCFLRFKFKYPSVPVYENKTVGGYSQDGQDLFLLSLLFNVIDRSDEQLYFIDVGCNHPEKFSNSLVFEKYFGFKILAVEPLVEYEEVWRLHRPSAIFENCALGSSSGSVDLQIPVNSVLFDDMFSTCGDLVKVEDVQIKKRRVIRSSLSELLIKNSIKKALICSIDVEGFEMEVLKGINFGEHEILCFCIENNTYDMYGDDVIRRFLGEQGYFFYCRLGFFDDVFVHRSLVVGA